MPQPVYRNGIGTQLSTQSSTRFLKHDGGMKLRVRNGCNQIGSRFMFMTLAVVRLAAV